MTDLLSAPFAQDAVDSWEAACPGISTAFPEILVNESVPGAINVSLEWAAWTNPWGEDGFLWLDRNHNHVVDDGRELFGTATVLPEGELACNGFEALAVFDRMENGGNADGRISSDDPIWGQLQVWVDRDHDAVAAQGETYRLPRLGIRSIDLEYVETDEVDGNMNAHTFQGTFARRIRHRGRWLQETLPVHDVFFQTGLTTPPDPD